MTVPFEREYLTSAGWLAADIMATVLQPPPPVDLRAWAVGNVVFPEGSPRPGPYRPEDFPFNDRILEVLSPDHPCREADLCKGAQIGGTILGMIFACGTMDLDPGPFLFTHPTEPNARRWMRLKLKPFIKASVSLRAILATEKAKDASATGMYVERKDGRGTIQLAGAASPSSLSEISMPRQVQDDLSKWDEDNGAGDPEGQADSRSKAYDNAKVFKVGTPTIEDNCRITRGLKGGTWEEWHVPCPHCGHMHVLAWENFKAALEGEGGTPDQPFFTCPKCSGRIHEHHRDRMNAGGRWIARNPKAPHVSFHLPSYYSPLARWSEMAWKWLQVRGNPDAEQPFFNDWLGLAYSRAGEAPPAEALKARAEESGHARGIVPKGHPLLVLGMDCQGDRVEVQVLAFGPNRRSAVVDYIVVPGHITETHTRAELTRLVNRAWPFASGRKVQADIVAIDANAYTDDVFDWIKSHPASRVIGVRGSQSDLAEPIALVSRDSEGKGKRRRRRSFGGRFFNVGSSGLKAMLYEFLKRTDPLSRGFVSLARGLGDDYFEQLTSERREQVTTSGGRRVFRWVPKKGVANEALDTFVYAMAAAIKRGWTRMDEDGWDALLAERDTPPPGGGQMDLENLILEARPASKPASPPPSIGPGQAAPPEPDPARDTPAPGQPRKRGLDRLA